MSFEAKHQSIQKFGDEVAALTDDTQTAVNYLNTWLDIDHEDARMFAQVVGKAEEVQQALVKNYQRLGQISTASSDELHKAAEFYRVTDQTEAARLDGTY